MPRGLARKSPSSARNHTRMSMLRVTLILAQRDADDFAFIARPLSDHDWQSDRSFRHVFPLTPISSHEPLYAQKACTGVVGRA